jgi:transcriptional regulator with XRE-family HTH domain
MNFGVVLRALRLQRALGLKTLAPELGVTHGYLSKLENGQTRPSEAFVRRVAEYFGYDSDLLLLASDHVPPDVMRILTDHPEEAIAFLRKRYGATGDGSRDIPANARG